MFLLIMFLAQHLAPSKNLINVKLVNEFYFFQALWKSEKVLILGSALMEHHSLQAEIGHQKLNFK